MKWGVRSSLLRTYAHWHWTLCPGQQLLHTPVTSEAMSSQHYSNRRCAKAIGEGPSGHGEKERIITERPPP